MFALGDVPPAGRAGPRDREASAKWLAAAAKLGHPLAAYDLALLYMEGQLFPQDFTRAAELLRIAARSRQSGSAICARHALQGGPRRAEGHERGGAAVGRSPRSPTTPTRRSNTRIALVQRRRRRQERTGRRGACSARPRCTAAPIAQDRLARILADGRGAPANPVEATKWHLISKARGETNLTLDDFVNKLDPDTRAAGEKAAQPFIDALKEPKG